MDKRIKLLMLKDYLFRKSKNKHCRTGIIIFSCPNCKSDVVSNYFYEESRLIGCVEYKSCKIALFIKCKTY